MVSSLPPSESSPSHHFDEMAKVANTKVIALRRAARKGEGKEAATMNTIFGTTWEDEFEIPYGECAASASAHSSRRSLTSYPGNLHPRKNLYAWGENPLHALQTPYA